jgi:CRISPR-associated protein Cmr6
VTVLRKARRECFYDVTFTDMLTKEIRRARGTHAGLWFDKYLLKQEDKIHEVNEQRELLILEENVHSRYDLVKEVCALPEPIMYKPFFERWKAILLDEHNAEVRCARVKGRMIVGLGLESVIETAVLLHRTYGVPYIPGSALKGLAASYVRQHLGKDWQKGSSQYKILFGDTDDAGYITFFDALYIPGSGYNKQALWPDIIAVHHQQYYQDKAAPADWDSPIPVPLLSATGEYLIALAAPDLQQRKQWLDLAFQILGQALDKSGIGAKTSSGYGRMEFVDCK